MLWFFDIWSEGVRVGFYWVLVVLGYRGGILGDLVWVFLYILYNGDVLNV